MAVHTTPWCPAELAELQDYSKHLEESKTFLQILFRVIKAIGSDLLMRKACLPI